MWLLLLVQGPKISRDLPHIGPERVGRPVGCAPVPMVQDGIRPIKVVLSRCRLKIRPDLYCGGLGSSLRFHKKGPSHGFSESPHHVAVVARVAA